MTTRLSACRRRCPGRSVAGYILLETIVSMTLMAVGLVGVFGALRASLAASGHARHLVAATMLAEGKLAEFRAAPPQTVGRRQGTFEEPFDGYAWRADIESVEGGELYRVLLAVLWVERGRERQLVLGTLVTFSMTGES